MAPARRLAVALITALALLFAFTRPVAERVVHRERVIRVAPPVAPSIVAVPAFHALKAKAAHASDLTIAEFVLATRAIGVDVAAPGERLAIRSAEFEAPDGERPLVRSRDPPRA